MVILGKCDWLLPAQVGFRSN